MIKPWSGIRILDISQGIAGPYCAQIMASQGAQVIKVEPTSGDWGRFVGVTHGDHSGLSLQYNQGKRGVALDAKHPEGRTLLRDMIRSCQVVIQNFRPGVAQRLGIDHDTLCADQPDLVSVSISGYGPDGPAADMPATDSVMQADSGLMYMNRTPDGTPRRVGMLMVDAVTGMYAAQALSAALYQRLATGQGTHVELNLFEACLAFQGMNLIEHAMAGPRPVGAVSAPNGVFRTADGQLTIVTLNNPQFEKLCRALDTTAWLSDPRFIDNPARMRNREVLDGLLNQVLQQAPTQVWVNRLREHEVLHAILRDYDDLMQHPQVAHLDPFQTHTVAGLNSVQMMSSPVAAFRHELSTAPVIGEHTIEVLRDLDVDETRIQELIRSGVLTQANEVGAQS